MKYVKGIIVCLLVLFFFVLTLQNYEELTTPIKFRANLGFTNYEATGVPIAIVAVFTFIIGVLACGLYGLAEILRLKAQIRKMTSETKEKEEELRKDVLSVLSVRQQAKLLVFEERFEEEIRRIIKELRKDKEMGPRPEKKF